MKKSILILAALLIAFSSSFSQQKKTESAAKPADKPVSSTAEPVTDTMPVEIKVYHTALLFADYDVAKNALFSLISKYPQRLDYLDSLARVYFSMGAYPQSNAAANIVLAKQPENLQLMELSAICLNAMKNDKEALALYEKLYGKTNSMYHLYQIAILQYQLKRYGECTTSIDNLLKSQDALTQKIQISSDEQNAQEVPLAAAAHNLRGVMEKDLAQPDKAKADFEAAIKIFPDFTLAKNNLEMMTKPASTEEKEKAKKK